MKAFNKKFSFKQSYTDKNFYFIWKKAFIFNHLIGTMEFDKDIKLRVFKYLTPEETEFIENKSYELLESMS